MEKIKVGMMGGGGPKNFFGNMHRRSIALDTTRELVAGALRRSADDSLKAARELGIRGYPDCQAMLEAQKSGEINLDYVTIVTTNEAHYPQAKAFIENEVPVLCEKPMTLTVEEARDLGKLVKAQKNTFCPGPYLYWTSHGYVGP